jgi:hypothetical protein
MSGNVFVSDEILLDLGFDAACRRLERLTEDGMLLRASEHAYAAGMTALVETSGLAAVRSRLARIDPTEVRGGARLGLRWEASGPGGAWFPALDADLTLFPAGEKTTLLALAGVYRVPSQAVAGLDPGGASSAATVTIRSFLAWLACAFPHPAGTAIPATTAGHNFAPRWAGPQMA